MTAPEDATPEDATPETAASDDVTPEDGASDDGTPEDGASDDGPAQDGTPEDGAPEHEVPDRIAVPLPAGARVLVCGDLHLGSRPTAASARIEGDLAARLTRWDGPGAVVLNGDVVELWGEPGGTVEAALDAHPEEATGDEPAALEDLPQVAEPEVDVEPVAAETPPEPEPEAAAEPAEAHVLTARPRRRRAASRPAGPPV